MVSSDVRLKTDTGYNRRSSQEDAPREPGQQTLKRTHTEAFLDVQSNQDFLDDETIEWVKGISLNICWGTFIGAQLILRVLYTAFKGLYFVVSDFAEQKRKKRRTSRETTEKLEQPEQPEQPDISYSFVREKRSVSKSAEVKALQTHSDRRPPRYTPSTTNLKTYSSPTGPISPGNSIIFNNLKQSDMKPSFVSETSLSDPMDIDTPSYSNRMYIMPAQSTTLGSGAMSMLKQSLTAKSTVNNEAKKSSGIFTPLRNTKPGSPMFLDTPYAPSSSASLLSNPIAKLFNVPEPTSSATTNKHFLAPRQTYGSSWLLIKEGGPEPNSETEQINSIYESNGNIYTDRLRRAFSGSYSSPKLIVPPPLKLSLQTPNNGLKLGIFKQFQDRRLSSIKSITDSDTRWNNEIGTRKVELPETLSAEVYAKAYFDLIAKRQKMHDQIDRIRQDTETIKLLDKSAIQKVEQIWSRRDIHSTVVSGFKIDISVSDLQTLADRKWLNDNVIDFYLSLVTERSSLPNYPKYFTFSTHFFTTLEGSKGYDGVARWAKRKKIDVTTLDYLFVPINRHSTHWCLAVVNNKEKKFQFFDSMNGSGAHALELLQNYMIKEAAKMHPGKGFGYMDYKICDRQPCPQQKNGYDCGVFTCKMIEMLSREKDLTFSQSDMPMLRRRMAYEILAQKLLN